MDYEEFRNRIFEVLYFEDESKSWSYVREEADLPQEVPNNEWVSRMEKEMGLIREKNSEGRVEWKVVPFLYKFEIPLDMRKYVHGCCELCGNTFYIYMSIAYSGDSFPVEICLPCLEDAYEIDFGIEPEPSKHDEGEMDTVLRLIYDDGLSKRGGRETSEYA